jgi:hypothetical protein
MQSVARVSQSLIQTARRLDALGFSREADQADALLRRVAQVMNNPVQQQLQMLMFSITQLNGRLKQIEEALAQGGNAPTPVNNTANMDVMQAAAVQTQQQAPAPDMGNGLTNPTIIHQMGDYQVTIGPEL